MYRLSRTCQETPLTCSEGAQIESGPQAEQHDLTLRSLVAEDCGDLERLMKQARRVTALPEDCLADVDWKCVPGQSTSNP